jgi:hypothetical protein
VRAGSVCAQGRDSSPESTRHLPTYESGVLCPASARCVHMLMSHGRGLNQQPCTPNAFIHNHTDIKFVSNEHEKRETRSRIISLMLSWAPYSWSTTTVRMSANGLRDNTQSPRCSAPKSFPLRLYMLCAASARTHYIALLAPATDSLGAGSFHFASQECMNHIHSCVPASFIPPQSAQRLCMGLRIMHAHNGWSRLTRTNLAPNPFLLGMKIIGLNLRHLHLNPQRLIGVYFPFATLGSSLCSLEVALCGRGAVGGGASRLRAHEAVARPRRGRKAQSR